ncbi:helix-turn-helix transcriptional regulator [Streptomyces sp. H10-C2]|uniref:helix-turn-helix transcriptional regulator n=1 Tax=unclassified Streptomyces TaxID=2593676 RepID=UPI0024B9FA48|nr:MULTISPECIES: helix-turn-helix transcriptional regulator [unclassified Streptomyces]MDJ0342812.1 helix-turn-helix transcriptional regulator [Streptomyces sp. PH10-H1]MDJ0372490.1 helix-turn-helix transcriptional regulator [Streptomyces sp. H10-C2]
MTTARQPDCKEASPALHVVGKAPHCARTTDSDVDLGERLYAALRTHGRAVLADLVPKLSMDPVDAARGWQYLLETGLVQHVPASNDFIPVDPEAVRSRLNTAAVSHSDELRRIHEASEVLAARFQPLVERELDAVAVLVLRNQDEKRTFLNHIAEETRWQICSMHPGPLPDPERLAASVEEDAGMVKSGLRLRAVYGQSVARSPRHRKYLLDLAAVGVEVRLADAIAFDLLIFDDRAAMLPGDPANPSETILAIRGSHLMPSYIAMFEDMWLRSVPLPAAGDAKDEPSTGEDYSAQHRTLLTLLAHGHEDPQIARRMGVTPRSVRRWLPALMEQLGAKSRFQAGMIAVARGLVDVPLAPPRDPAE